MKANPKLNASDEIDNPCIRHCCLNEHDVCVGCFRHYEEILAWRSMDKQAKIAVKEKASIRQSKSSS